MPLTIVRWDATLRCAPHILALSFQMKSSFTKENIYELITSLSGYENIEITEKGVAYDLVLSANGKSVCITWPYELGEVFLAYIEGSTTIFEDWFECMEEDEVNDFIEYIDTVTKRYLFNETRIKEKGLLLKNHELQYQSKEGWLNVLHP